MTSTSCSYFFIEYQVQSLTATIYQYIIQQRQVITTRITFFGAPIPCSFKNRSFYDNQPRVSDTIFFQAYLCTNLKFLGMPINNFRS